MFNQSLNGGHPPPTDTFYTSPFSPFVRRHTPYFGSPDYRIYEMNKRLQQRTEVSQVSHSGSACQRLTSVSPISVPFLIWCLQDSDNLWWDAFATEFFEDDATLTLTFCLEDGPKRYSKSALTAVDQLLMCVSFLAFFGWSSHRPDTHPALLSEHLRGRRL